MNIDNAQLAAFAAVLHEGSFEAAARALHLTPSAISQRIKQLEERLGQVLLQRTTPCLATAAGKTLARYTEQLALLEAEMLGEFQLEFGAARTPAGLAVRMPVAVNADSLDGWFLGVFDDLTLRDEISFDIRVEDQDHSAAMLREGSVMAAVSASAAAVQGCLVEPLGIMRYRAVASPAYVARHFPDGVDAAAFTRAPVLTFNRKDALQQRFIALFAAHAQPTQTHFVPSTHGFVDVAKRGLGWGMMPEHFVNEALAAGELVEIVPGHSFDQPLFWHRWRLNSPALNVLSAAVHRAAAASLRLT